VTWILKANSRKSILRLLGICAVVVIAYKYSTDSSDSENSDSTVIASTNSSSTSRNSTSPDAQNAVAADFALCRKYDLREVPCSGESEFIPWATNFDFVWRRDSVYEANARLEEFEEALREFGNDAKIDLTPLFDTAIRNSLARGQEAFSRRPSVATVSDREQLLASQVEFFNLVLDALVHLNTALRESEFRKIQIDLEEMVSGYALARIDDVQRLAIDGKIFATSAISNQGDQTYAQAMFGLNSQSELTDYVQASINRINALGTNYALPFVVYLLNSSGAVGTENVRIWSETLTEIDKHENNDANNDIDSLQSYIQEVLSQPIAAGCSRTPAPKPRLITSSWYSLTQTRLEREFAASCR